MKTVPEIQREPKIVAATLKKYPNSVWGRIYPYPTVVVVINMYQRQFSYNLKGLWTIGTLDYMTFREKEKKTVPNEKNVKNTRMGWSRKMQRMAYSIFSAPTEYIFFILLARGSMYRLLIIIFVRKIIAFLIRVTKRIKWLTLI